MEAELKSIALRCKERDILFTRDWDSVTQPCLVRENPSTYMKINQIIKDGDQGVIQRVSQVQMEKAQEQEEQPKEKTDTYSFSFQG